MRFSPYSIIGGEQFVPFTIEFTVVGGGAAGSTGGNGGGGGGVWTGSIEITGHYGYDIQIGQGGTTASVNGESSSFGPNIAVGGGVGTSGGTGGVGGFVGGTAGTTLNCAPYTIGSGGGGANSNGSNVAACNKGGDGAIGILRDRWNGSQYFGGGGGGGVTDPIALPGVGAPIGQAAGGTGGTDDTAATNGATNQGGGGGGKGAVGDPGNGSAGIVIVRYQSEYPKASGGQENTGGGGWYYHEFTGSGILQF